MPLGRKTPIGKPGWGSMLSVVDGGLTSISWEDLDPTLVQAIQQESDGLALGDLKINYDLKMLLRLSPEEMSVS